jgi:hypothetical protein
MYVTQTRLDGILDVSASIPQVELRRGSSIVLAQINLTEGQRLRLRWLSIRLLRLLNNPTPVKICTGLGLVYAGIYGSGFDGLSRPSGSPIVGVALNTPSYRALNPYHFRDFTSPDSYEVLLVNNTENVDLDVTASGVLRYFIDG